MDERQRSKELTLEQAFESTFHERFSFDDFRAGSIVDQYVKINRNGRYIYNPTSKLKKYHRFLNSFVFNYSSVNEKVAHSYRKGKSTLTALDPHKKSQYFFVTDIEKFFDNITADDVKNVVENQTAGSPISDLIRYNERILEMVTVRGLLPIGFPTSPPITNSHLLTFDNALFDFCIASGLVYTRYSDDLIISSTNRNVLTEMEATIEKMLHEILGIQYSLRESKTKLLNKGNRITILGLTILPNGRITADKGLKKNMESLLHLYIKDKEKYRGCLNRHFDGRVGVVKGRLNYLNTVDPDYVEKLKRRYGTFVVDYFNNEPAE